MSAELQEAFDSISKIVEAAKADRDRFGNIAATIRINALRNGATTDEAEAMVQGNVDFLKWVSAKVEANTTPPEHDPQDCTEDDGCPTEKAVLKRFWREHRTRTDLSQASVAAALEAAAKEHDAEIVRLEAQIIENNKYLRLVGKSERSSSNDFCNTAIGHHRGSAVRLRDLITQAQHDALAAHVAAEVAKARAEDAAKIDGSAGVRIRDVAQYLIDHMPAYNSEHPCWEALQDANDDGADEDDCIRAWLRSIAQIGAKP